MGLDELRRRASGPLALPLARVLGRMGVSPDALTWIGTAGSLAAGAAIAWGEVRWGAVLLLLSSGTDLLDGAVARLTGRATPQGALLDSTLDRLAEAAIFLGILLLAARAGRPQEAALAGIAMTGSFLVSYIKARGEGLGLSCPVGFFTRPERVGVLVVGLFFNQLTLALGAIALFSFLTAGQRFLYLRQQIRRNLTGSRRKE